MLIGSLRGESAAPVLVVFQSALGGLRTDWFQCFRQNRFWILHIAGLSSWLPIMVLFVIWRGARCPSIILFSVTSLSLLVLWAMILCVLHWEYHKSGPTIDMGDVERRGLAVLLEL